MSFPCILIPILVGLICALLGYFLGRLVEKQSKVYTKLRADLDACRKETKQLQSENNSLEKELASLSKKSTAAEPGFDADLAASVFGNKVVENDLKIIEGIGPKIEELFHNAGINTWKALSETSVEKCQQILDEAGDRFKIHSPATWPSQAETAYQGLWKVLKWWQDDMIGGRE
jgi:predicted flap endonuclease-1-like 5' DNA nuclease